MEDDDLDTTIGTARGRRKVTEARRAGEAAEKEDQTTDTFRIQWDHAAPGYLGAWGGHDDMMHAKAKLDVLVATVPDVPAFLEWVVTEWRTLKHRSGTSWMVEKDMLPRHPTMRFVLHHWSHFHASYIDRAEEVALNYVNPEFDDLREDIAFLEGKLREAVKLGPVAQMDRLRKENERIKIENTRLRAQLAPLVDLDTDLPTWEEKQNDKV